MSTTPAESSPLAESTKGPFSAAEPANGEPVTLPDDHPLVTAFNTLKAENKSLKSERLDPTELQRLRDLDEASKTQAEKDAEALAAAQAKVKEYETREQIAAWKAEVATATGVPAVALAGSTKEEIEAHAETLKPLIATPAPKRPGIVPSEGRAVAPGSGSTADQFAAAVQPFI